MTGTASSRQEWTGEPPADCVTLPVFCWLRPLPAEWMMKGVLTQVLAVSVEWVETPDDTWWWEELPARQQSRREKLKKLHGL